MDSNTLLKLNAKFLLEGLAASAWYPIQLDLMLAWDEEGLTYGFKDYYKVLQGLLTLTATPPPTLIAPIVADLGPR